MKLIVKKTAKAQLVPDEANLVKVERKMFGNKKLMTDHIIFKRAEVQTN